MANKRPAMLGQEANEASYENDSVDAKAAAKFFVMLLNAVTVAHLLHFKQTGPGSFARHMALGELYSGLQDKTDELVEAWQGCMNILITDYPALPWQDQKDAITFVDALYEFVESARGEVSKETHIQNIIDEICTIISTARYKLKRLA